MICCAGSSFALLLCCAAAVVFVCGAGACDSVLTHAEIATDRSRAVEFFHSSGAAFGHTVNAAGDVNGDGFDDFAISAPNAGTVFLVFGRSASAWASATFDFNASDTPDPASWIKIFGNPSNTLREYGIAHGDFNGDGISDLLLGTSLEKVERKAFCVYGHMGPWSSFNVSEIESREAPGFVIGMGSSENVLLGNAGDMNGDGIEDVFVSVFNGFSTNLAHFVFGVAGPTRSDFDFNSIDGQNGFTMQDGTMSLADSAAGSAGDVNGDGLADLVLGSRYANSNGGCAYVLFARNVSSSPQQDQWAASFNLFSELNGTNGFIVNGPPSSQLGWAVVGAGDVNADGFADIFVGSYSNDAGAWIVFGHPSPWNSPVNASLFDGTNGFHFKDLGQGEYWGWSGGAAGDVNGDGIDDLVIGGLSAQNFSGSKTGFVAVVFGHSGAWPAELDRNDTVGPVGFLVEGPSVSSYFGHSARGAGDVNGDGLADFIVGAYGSSTGYAALVFGFDDHCAVCSNTTDECLVCDDGFILNGTFCKSNATISWSSSASSTAVVVVIETGGGGGSASDVAAEVAQLLGVDVGQISVVEITPGTFEVTVINEEVAQQLVDLIEKCIEEDAASEQ